eukprot:comp24315_c2_seq2/m.45763 comp24315_c2_seq2/g.45763  ORF comp24315_c2_seq2/g.45763 comp24315_c2_seq2/m.45763 type:complete len:475 (-) comp24315_c2_seq2:56-1480(-)
MYQRIQNSDGTWAMAKTLFIPCINKKTDAVEFCLSTISLECGDTQPMPSRASECRLLEDKSPLVFGDVEQIRSLCEKAARRAGEDELSEGPWITQDEASALNYAVKWIDEATGQSYALFVDPSPGNSQSRANNQQPSREASEPQGYLGLLEPSQGSANVSHARDLLPKKGDSRSCDELEMTGFRNGAGEDTICAKGTAKPSEKGDVTNGKEGRAEKPSNDEGGLDTAGVTPNPTDMRKKKQREDTRTSQGIAVAHHKRLLLSIDVNSGPNTSAGLCAEATNRNELFDRALPSYSLQITSRNQPFFPEYNDLNEAFFHPGGPQPAQGVEIPPPRSNLRISNEYSLNVSISTSNQSFSFSSLSSADLAQLLRQHITATNELAAANARSNLGLTPHPISGNLGLPIGSHEQPTRRTSAAPSARFLLPRSIANAQTRPIADSILSDCVIDTQTRQVVPASKALGGVSDGALSRSGTCS